MRMTHSMASTRDISKLPMSSDIMTEFGRKGEEVEF